MSSSIQRHRIRPLLISLGIVIIAALSGFSAYRPQAGRTSTEQSRVPNITNRTTALRVIKTSISDGEFPELTISLVNESSRNINGYVVAIGNLSITTDFASVGEVMEPGGIRVEKVALSNFHLTSQKPTHELSIAAVSFQGQSGEGDATELKLLLDRHSGIKEQVSALLPLLREAQSSFSSAALADLERNILTKNQVPKAVSGPTKEGQEWVIQQVQRKLQSSKHRGDIEDMIVFYENLLANL